MLNFEQITTGFETLWKGYQPLVISQNTTGRICLSFSTLEVTFSLLFPSIHHENVVINRTVSLAMSDFICVTTIRLVIGPAISPFSFI